jgi:nucleotidyltransferase AbiEii toxin of type IV toxin-antitoxin system
VSELTELVGRIRAAAAARGEPLAEAVRHHLILGAIARIARAPEGASFVLRGGALTRAWVAPLRRPARDLDYVGDFPFDVGDTARRLAPGLAMELPDGVRLDAARTQVRGIWLDTQFPGVRVDVAIGLGRPDQRLSIDIGFGDPLVPPATRVELDGGVVVRAVRPETQLAWKLHGLAEMGASWRPKDLADLWAIATRVPLEAAQLPPALAAAFESRGLPVGAAAAVLRAPHWGTKTARVRWAAQPRDGVPDLAQTLADVRERLAPVLETQAR